MKVKHKYRKSATLLVLNLMQLATWDPEYSTFVNLSF